jgi:hypothetical protein
VSNPTTTRTIPVVRRVDVDGVGDERYAPTPHDDPIEMTRRLKKLAQIFFDKESIGSVRVVKIKA